MKRKNILRIAVVTIGVIAAICSFSSCKHSKKEMTDAIADRALIPVLDGTDITTLISDSGITRYRITAHRWQIYDKAQPPYWEFVDGIYLEKFNEELQTEASIRSDYAHYDSDAQLWELRGNVHAVNMAGEVFDTPLLYWNQRSERIYSDSMIHIVRATSTIHGYGFESNQQMSKYTILHPTGVFPVEE